MTVTLRRRIARISLAADITCLIVLVVAGSVSGFHHWRAGFTAMAFAAVSIAAGLFYLHRSGGRS